MRLANLKLQNFRAFNNLDIHLHPRLNVFIGPNGCGKSSILVAASCLVYELTIEILEYFNFWFDSLGKSLNSNDSVILSDLKYQETGDFDFITKNLMIDYEHQDRNEKLEDIRILLMKTLNLISKQKHKNQS